MNWKNAVVQVTVVCHFVLVPVVVAQHLSIDPPGERAFVQDLARMVQPDDVMAIRAIGEGLLKEMAIPIIVVTIDSMAQHGGSGWRIETFARVLFDQWGIGYETIEGQPWNRGVLLLVSKNDRKARIELGNDWAGAYDRTCERIMNEQIIPNFKKGNFSGGILAGVQNLEKMCRGVPESPPIASGRARTAPDSAQAEPEPKPVDRNLGIANQNIRLSQPVRPDWYWPAVGVTVFLAIFTAISMIRSGSSGWAWALWAVVFGVLGTILWVMFTRQSYGGRHYGGGGFGGGGGFSGGSFGGGFGGGGGATGSW